MAKYKIRSEYIKKKIKEGSFKDENFRYYTEGLAIIEEFITTGREIAAPGLNHTANVIDNHPEEYLAMLKELKPKEHPKELRRIRRENREVEQADKWCIREEKRELAAKKKWWVEAGGKTG